MLLNINHLKSEKAKELLNLSNRDFSDYIYGKYPEFFQYRLNPKNDTPMYPIRCGTGLDIPKGWHFLFDNLCATLKAIYDETGLAPCFVQLKEKFGTGRFYYEEIKNTKNLSEEKVSHWTRIIWMIITDGETDTSRVCSELGVPYSFNYEHVDANGWTHGMCWAGFEQYFRNKEENKNKSEDEIVKKLTEIKKKNDFYAEKRRTLTRILYNVKDENDLNDIKILNGRFLENKNGDVLDSTGV